MFLSGGCSLVAEMFLSGGCSLLWHSCCLFLDKKSVYTHVFRSWILSKKRKIHYKTIIPISVRFVNLDKKRRYHGGLKLEGKSSPVVRENENAREKHVQFTKNFPKCSNTHTHTPTLKKKVKKNFWKKFEKKSLKFFLKKSLTNFLKKVWKFFWQNVWKKTFEKNVWKKNLKKIEKKFEKKFEMFLKKSWRKFFLCGKVVKVSDRLPTQKKFVENQNWALKGTKHLLCREKTIVIVEK